MMTAYRNNKQWHASDHSFDSTVPYMKKMLCFQLFFLKLRYRSKHCDVAFNQKSPLHLIILIWHTASDSGKILSV